MEISEEKRAYAMETLAKMRQEWAEEEKRLAAEAMAYLGQPPPKPVIPIPQSLLDSLVGLTWEAGRQLAAESYYGLIRSGANRTINMYIDAWRDDFIHVELDNNVIVRASPKLMPGYYIFNKLDMIQST